MTISLHLQSTSARTVPVAPVEGRLPQGVAPLRADIASVVNGETEIDGVLVSALRLVRESGRLGRVSIWQMLGDGLVPRALDSAAPRAQGDAWPGTPGQAIRMDRPVLVERGEMDGAWVAAGPAPRFVAAAPIRAGGQPWGTLAAESGTRSTAVPPDLDLVEAIASLLGVAVHAQGLRADAARELDRAEALRQIASQAGAALGLDDTLTRLVDHSMAFFGADRAAIFARRPDGQVAAEVARGLSPAYLAALRTFPDGSLSSAAIATRRPLSAVARGLDATCAGDGPSAGGDAYTICAAPFFDGTECLGLLLLCHDGAKTWTPAELETMATLASQASIAIRGAQQYSKLMGWAAQLQSIQHLGVRLNRLSSVREIGAAITAELQQLLQYDNVRVYRQEGDELLPVAVQALDERYLNETVEQLRVKVGDGITGWVAKHGVPVNLPDAERDPRILTVPGTGSLEESMLLAPMVFEGRILGVLSLSRHGLSQFTADDLRLLVIYASFAAQAMANAEATERLLRQSETLERQLRSQRDLLHITESILATLDPRAILEQIAERLGGLVRSDTISIEVLDPVTRRLTPLARSPGLEARAHEPGLDDLTAWVIEQNEARLVDHADPEPASRIAVPLRGRDGAIGVLVLERGGPGHRFDSDEFDLVQLFAAQVSIALQNAEAHRAVEVRAQTDGLTGLLNHATLRDRLARSVRAADPFTLLMLDLDGFKAVNDAHGHPAGDRLLSRIATAIVAASRDTDQVFRYGGDEFAVLLPHTDIDTALRIADRIRHAMGAIASTAGSEPDSPEISASVGLASFPADARTGDEILLAADRACFVAKRAGRGRIATAAEGLALAAEFTSHDPTPVDSNVGPAA